MEDDCRGLPELFGQWTADRGPRTSDHELPTTFSWNRYEHEQVKATWQDQDLAKYRFNVLQRKSNVIAPETVADSRYTSITVCEWSKFHILDRALHPVGKA